MKRGKEDRLRAEIERLKQERKAIILAHNYQPGEVQDLADYVGDSLGLSQQAARTDAEVIVFCGVHFMAETASILCPEKTVLMPDPTAGCPMADMVDVEGLQALKREHPQALVVAYVNTTAAVKAESDLCCTSANAAKVIASLEPEREIIFVPDKYLGQYTASQLGDSRRFVFWNGFCPSHVRILPEHIQQQRAEHPEALVMVHPECLPEVTALADEVLSTSGMCRVARETTRREVIVGTETGILHRLRRENPDKRFYPATELCVCPNMKKNSLEKVLWALQEMKYEVKVPEEVRVRAWAAVERMLAVT
ncbi:MAG TPA: quinolinate synthase NadA [Armatimonadetes bacterium]|nr:quinolinate synthase NadA [Armatimonadota bacterium]